jgi:hypothetical protein
LIAVHRHTAVVALPATALSAIALLALPAEPRAVAWPALVIVNVAIWFLVVLWNRDRELPLFELGTICVAFTALYAAYPLVAYLLADGLWTAASDRRLRVWAPDMQELGRYSWGSVAYIAGLASAYLAIRGRATAAGVRPHPLSATGSMIVVWLFLVLVTYFAWLWVWFGVTYNPSYQDVELGQVGVARDLPYVLQQISHNARGILSILKLCALAFLMHRWSSIPARVVLIAWLVGEIAATALRMGARTEIVVLLLSAVLLYHRLVRPLDLKVIAVAAPALVCAALLFGFARDFMRGGSSTVTGSYWAAANEFQILLGTGFDLHKRREAGILENPPWQVYAADALRLVPSQLLGVQKIEPSDWYLEQLGVTTPGVGMMFGVMGQAAIGYGPIELLLRGSMLGLLFALVHRAYARRAGGFWVTMLYLYLCLWSYYTIRASSFYFVYVIVYRFLPTMLFVVVATDLVGRAARSSPSVLRLGSAR